MSAIPGHRLEIDAIGEGLAWGHCAWRCTCGRWSALVPPGGNRKARIFELNAAHAQHAITATAKARSASQ
jgi:hypothetical protein